MNIAKATVGMQPNEIVFEVNRGARFVVFQYCISIVFMTFKRNAPLQFLKPGENPAVRGLPWTLLSLVLGWWGIPWGFIYTPQVVYRNLKGGTDVTASVLNRLTAPPPPPMPAQTSIAPPPPIS